MSFVGLLIPRIGRRLARHRQVLNILKAIPIINIAALMIGWQVNLQMVPAASIGYVYGGLMAIVLASAVISMELYQGTRTQIVAARD